MLNIRAGIYSVKADELAAACQSALAHTILPDKLDRNRMEQWLMAIQTRWICGDQTLIIPIDKIEI